jgi:hypothetical protein
MLRLGTLCGCLLWTLTVWAADLTISAQNNRTYSNGTYDKLVMTNSSNITVRNCKFSANSGAVGSISGSDHILIDSCEFDGQASINTCTGLSARGSYITIRKCKIHDIADDGMETGGDHMYYYDNEIYNLMGCGTDGGCGPCYNGHSDGIEINFTRTAEIKRNIMHHIKSTAGIFFGNFSNPYMSNITLEQNLIYVPEAAFCAYVHYVDTLNIYNNVFYYGVYGGLAIGPAITKLKARNNICSNIDFATDGGSYNAAQMDFDYNCVSQILGTTTIPRMAHDIQAANPNFKRIPHYLSGTTSIANVVADDFNLKTTSAAVDKGVNEAGVPTTDFYGITRTDPYDMGAFNVIKTLIQQPGFDMRTLFPFAVTMKPCPTLGRTVFALENFSDDLLPVNLAIYAVDGRLVHEMFVEGHADAVVWDGKDRQDQLCPAGYYQVRVTTARSVENKTLVVVR